MKNCALSLKKEKNCSDGCFLSNLIAFHVELPDLSTFFRTNAQNVLAHPFEEYGSVRYSKYFHLSKVPEISNKVKRTRKIENITLAFASHKNYHLQFTFKKL